MDKHSDKKKIISSTTENEISVSDNELKQYCARFAEYKNWVRYECKRIKTTICIQMQSVIH